MHRQRKMSLPIKIKTEKASSSHEEHIGQTKVGSICKKEEISSSEGDSGTEIELEASDEEFIDIELETSDEELIDIELETEIHTNNDPEVVRKKDILYGIGADAVCEFENGKSVAVNKSFLAYESAVFQNLFFGKPAAKTVKIYEIDDKAFKKFLDGLFDFEDYTVSDALKIYPVAHEFQVKKALKKCVDALVPAEMNGNVCRTLNIASFYKEKELLKTLINFIDTEVGFFSFIQNENFLNLLEPDAVSQLVQNTKMNSYLWVALYRWGESYLKKQGRSADVCSLFKTHGISLKMRLTDFESVESLLNFHQMSNQEMLDPNEILTYLKSNSVDHKNLPEKSSWIEHKSEDKIVEDIIFKNTFRIPEGPREEEISISIQTNSIYSSKMLNNVEIEVCCYYQMIPTIAEYSRGKWAHKEKDALYFDNPPTSYDSPSSNLEAVHPKFEADVDEDLEVYTLLSLPMGFKETCSDKEAKKKFFYKFIYKRENEFLIKGFRITYSFPCKCTICKTSLRRDLTISDKLFFTENVSCCYTVVSIVRDDLESPSKRRKLND